MIKQYEKSVKINIFLAPNLAGALGDGGGATALGHP